MSGDLTFLSRFLHLRSVEDPDQLSVEPLAVDHLRMRPKRVIDAQGRQESDELYCLSEGDLVGIVRPDFWCQKPLSAFPEGVSSEGETLGRALLRLAPRHVTHIIRVRTTIASMMYRFGAEPALEPVHNYTVTIYPLSHLCRQKVRHFRGGENQAA